VLTACEIDATPTISPSSSVIGDIVIDTWIGVPSLRWRTARCRSIT
jgi:hypothetical protein